MGRRTQYADSMPLLKVIVNCATPKKRMVFKKAGHGQGQGCVALALPGNQYIVT